MVRAKPRNSRTNMGGLTLHPPKKGGITVGTKPRNSRTNMGGLLYPPPQKKMWNYGSYKT